MVALPEIAGEACDAQGERNVASRPNDDASGRLTAIVVYFRTPSRLEVCLDALRQQTEHLNEIIVVDNSSALDGIDERPAGGGDWRWVRADTNLGFGAACNLGARLAQGDYLLFLNADVSLCPDATAQLRSCAAASPRVGAVGPRIYGKDGEIELSARAFPSISTGLLGRSSFLTRGLVAMKLTPRGLSGARGAGGPVDWISGACMLVRHQAFQQVGGFDEGYWMYWEDADVCRRLKNQGWATILCPAARAGHSAGSSGRTERTIEAFHESAARYYERHLATGSISTKLARSALRARMWLSLRRYGRSVAR